MDSRTFVVLGIFFCLSILAKDLPVAEALWGGLYPNESPSREIKTLDGVWNFRRAPRLDPDQGFREEWYNQPLKKSGSVIPMAVPSSYNDITQDKSLREHIGWVWYDRMFVVPSRWQEDNLRVFLRLGSAHYHAIIYLNGLEIASHEGGHLPIRAEITNFLLYGQENLVTVALNNILTPQTIPQGKIVYHNESDGYPNNYFIQTYDFDFFNYAGIHRPVVLYTTPQTYIEDILINTDIDGADGIITYNLTTSSVLSNLHGTRATECVIEVLDKLGEPVANTTGCSGTIRVANANFWWPYMMAAQPGYLYTLWISINDGTGRWDSYPEKVGIRTVGLNSTNLSINDVPIYIRGLGKHEDSDVSL
ncbi:hypothetical protein SK128_002912 [Halocaridina rubra]|uniref:Beta-glucuronidase n=1 Tax=Halocaridina rubra TaxID=373956 RepID=A0AAN8ZVV1_HALRR